VFAWVRSCCSDCLRCFVWSGVSAVPSRPCSSVPVAGTSPPLDWPPPLLASAEVNDAWLEDADADSSGL
jgi:hypothetical protein